MSMPVCLQLFLSVLFNFSVIPSILSLFVLALAAATVSTVAPAPGSSGPQAMHYPPSELWVIQARHPKRDTLAACSIEGEGSNTVHRRALEARKAPTAPTPPLSHNFEWFKARNAPSEPHIMRRTLLKANITPVVPAGSPKREVLNARSVPQAPVRRDTTPKP
ncbi:hypothetical protein Moror_17086 [Moniliophthora roreri MCA 2997]|uniref:Uncharacterized protein n=1 Tax=Moniliophthora roreri (strain MCA 2997) TaxID=1381753 RepID=V2WPP1_MONRO|nr:hypothetical protein Moror_17086 [Moniliophthora roreri MCA 2997]